MKHLQLFLAMVIGLNVLAPSAFSAEETKQPTTPPQLPQPQSKKEPAPVPVVYKPPVRGAPGGRVGGGTRGPRDLATGLAVLAPDHTGLTTQDQPDLYWYLPQLTQFPVEFTLIEENAIRPIVETRLASPSTHGIQRIRMADFDAKLRLGTEYRWFVAIVSDPDSRSKDALAGGYIELVEAEANLKTGLNQVGAAQHSRVYAESGLWYDAIASLSAQIDSGLNNNDLRRLRAALLDQIGLPEVAAFDRR